MHPPRLWAFALVVALVLPGAVAQQTERGPRIEQAVAQIEEELIAIRRDIHEHPELSNREQETAKLVVERLKAIGVPAEDIRTGVAGHGVVALIRGAKAAPVAAIRADMDALPVTEETGLPFASTVRATYKDQEVGVMHACGHDLNIAMLLGVAQVLQGMREELPGSVKLIFQPCEEGAPPGEEGGAKVMVGEGVLEDPKPGAIFALHGYPDLDVGSLGTMPGGIFASVDRFRIRIIGQQTHAAYPWLGTDPIVTAAQAILALQTIHSRQLDTRQPSVVSVCIVQGGTRWNIIPDEVELVGTVRTHDETVRAAIRQKIEQTLQGVTAAAGASYEMAEYAAYGPVTYNDPGLTGHVMATLRRVFGPDNVHEVERSMGGEDYAYFAQEVPGCYFYVGVHKPGTPPTSPLHSPTYNPDEGAIAVGVRAMANVVWDWLEGAEGG